MLRLFTILAIAVLLAATGAFIVQPGAFAAAQEPGSDAAIAEPPGTGDGPGYVWDREFDASGFYLPTSDLVASGWVLDHIHVGRPEDFDAWEEESMPSMIPVWIDFHHEDSPTGMGELGEYFLDTKRVRAQGFFIEPGRFDLRALDPELNSVVISGMFHPEHFHAPGGVPSPEPSLTGGAEINGERFRNVSFTHWLGD
ncbi:hypothetical protein E5163_08310 [Marinicauda algicola]|uniref:Uncharacterized protein n=1 Tax=Marinicauda algicola TaxID=2029849 RepID=A0A4V3RY58_9PROT|nr:hypothetical protein [Marinicauda algicola]TGY89119.1 hypothetical protein E5163_08310 [Marinicauda algicola]